ncbi:MAG: hypothetical protein AVDCRST_MAG29-148, partial [uncultured Nocardioidaceae bacterium]
CISCMKTWRARIVASASSRRSKLARATSLLWRSGSAARPSAPPCKLACTSPGRC